VKYSSVLGHEQILAARLQADREIYYKRRPSRLLKNSLEALCTCVSDNDQHELSITYSERILLFSLKNTIYGTFSTAC